MREAALSRAVGLVGGSRRLARLLGLTRQAVEQWPRCPALRVLAVERATGVPRFELRPDLYPEVPRGLGAAGYPGSADDPTSWVVRNGTILMAERGEIEPLQIAADPLVSGKKLAEGAGCEPAPASPDPFSGTGGMNRGSLRA